ncbi:hypothetical protein [Acaryochloris marina]|nr:hypothetical protein [Acaryochloris marina]
MTIGVWDRIEIQPTMITFTPTTADRILQLRHQVLRPASPPSFTASFAYR